MTMTEKTKPLALGLALTALLAITPVFAQSTSSPVDTNSAPSQGSTQHQEHHKGWHHHHCDMMSKLNLSETQKTQMKAMRESMKQQNASLFQDMKSKHEALHQMMKAGQGKSTQAQALISELKQDRESLRSKYDAQLQTILTPEQYQQFQSMREQCKAKAQQWRQQHPHGSEKGAGTGASS